MNPSLGIEISDSYLKLVAVRSGALKAAGTAPVEFVVESIHGLPDDQISKKITSALQKIKFKAKETTICVPRNMLTVKTLQLPTRDPKESEQMIDLHLTRLVPYKKEEVLSGHQFLGVGATGQATEMLGIIHRTIARRQYSIVEASGLLVDKMVLSSHAAWQWLLSNFKSEMNDKDLYMLLDVDHSFIDLIIFSSGQLLFSRTIAIGFGNGKTDPASDALKLINEIKQSLIIFYNEALHKKPVGFFLSGSSAIKILREKVAAEFNLPVKEVPSPVSKIAPGSMEPELVKSVSLSAVSELALEDNPNRIFFVLPEAQIKKTLKEKTKDLMLLGILLAYLFTAFMGFFIGRLAIKQFYLSSLKNRSAQIEESVGVMISQARKIEFVRDFLYMRQEPLAIMQELQKITPPKIAINYLSLDDAYNMTLRGEGEQLSNVFEFTTLLEKSPYFANVVTKRTRTKRVKNREVTDFEITLNSSINK